VRWSVLSLFVVLLSACGGGGNDGPAPGSNANLAALTVSAGTLNPAFAPATLNYAAEVANSVSSVTVTPTAQSATASITVNGSAVASGTASPPVALPEGDTPIAIVVTAEDGTRQSYQITMTRLPPPSTNANLDSLVLSVAALDQPFDPTLTDYTATAGYFGSSTRVVAIPEDAGATLLLNGTALTAGTPSDPVPLLVGDNALNVDVTAEDTVTTRAYSVTTTRSAAATAQQQAYVKASNPGPDRFGASLAAFEDTVVVGAPYEQSAATGINGNELDNSLIQAGAAYLFNRTGTTGVQTAYIKASNTKDGDQFGSSAAVHGDLAAVGAPLEDSGATGINGDEASTSQVDSGAIYVFDLSGVVPAQNAYVKASNTEAGDQFGTTVALGSSLMAVGAPLEDSGATGINGDESDTSEADSGAAYVFDVSGALPVQAAYVKASNTKAGDRFGSALALSTNLMAAGAPLENSGAMGINGDQNDTSQVDSGAVYVFDASGALPVQRAYVKASNTDAGDEFGAAVALDASLLAVGAPSEDGGAAGVNGNQADNTQANAGAVYVFEQAASGTWSQIAYVKASNPRSGARFGSSVVVSGNLLLVGSPGESSNATGIGGDEADTSKPNSGAAYVFERAANGTWSQIAYVKASNTDAGDEFGTSVATARDLLVIGARFEQSASPGIDGNEADNTLNEAGAVYVIR